MHNASGVAQSTHSCAGELLLLPDCRVELTACSYAARLSQLALGLTVVSDAYRWTHALDRPQRSERLEQTLPVILRRGRDPHNIEGAKSLHGQLGV